MILVFSPPEEYDEILDEYGFLVYEMDCPLESRKLVDLLRYFRDVKLSDEDTNSITNIYVLHYQSKKDLNTYYFEDYAFSTWFYRLPNLFCNIKPFSASTWKEIIKKGQTEKVVFYSKELLPNDAIELTKIPAKNLDLYLEPKKTKYDTSVLNFLLGFPEVAVIESSILTIYESDKILFDLFQEDVDFSNLPKPGYVLHANTNDFELANFLISDFIWGQHTFWYDGKGDLEELNDKYDAMVIENFNLISPQRQNTLWYIMKGFGFDKKPVFIVGQDSKIIPTIIQEANFIRTELFDFKSIRGNFVKFLIYYYKETGIDTHQFQPYWYVDDFYKKSFFHAANFNILIKALRETGIEKKMNLKDPLAFYRLYLQIEKLNKIEKDHSIVVKPKTGYIWKFRGNFWEISFNYSEPILVKDVLGIFYIGSFLEKAGEEISIPKLREEAGISEGNGVLYKWSALKKALDDAIKIIEDVERQLGLRKNLSKYLNKIRYIPGLFPQKDYCKWPKDPNITWEVFRPKIYFIKERGTNNPSGIKK
jgi:hypothetical protein